MEEHAIAIELQHSRAQLRALLIPDPETGRVEADVFPRSAVMRVLFSAGKRNLAMSAIGGALSMIAGRRRSSRSGSRWSRVLHSLVDVVGSRRR